MKRNNYNYGKSENYHLDNAKQVYLLHCQTLIILFFISAIKWRNDMSPLSTTISLTSVERSPKEENCH